MTITAQIITDSISPAGKRLTTMQLRYPRFIHSEFMTHRVFSRNASSSRAIPVKKMIEDLRRDPAMPVFWGSNKPGMQAGEELIDMDLKRVKDVWLAGMEEAIETAEILMASGLHKQIANRILEPWAHINVVVSATEWQNFFALRDHKDAQPEIRALAQEMLAAFAGSTPTLLQPGMWHLPYIKREDWLAAKNHLTLNGVLRMEPTMGQLVEVLVQVSAARCARVSYLTHDGRVTSVEEDLELFKKLLIDTPLHASPAEHGATPDVYVGGAWTSPELHGNLVGWKQFRKMLPNEYVSG